MKNIDKKDYNYKIYNKANRENVIPTGGGKYLEDQPFIVIMFSNIRAIVKFATSHFLFRKLSRSNECYSKYCILQKGQSIKESSLTSSGGPNRDWQGEMESVGSCSERFVITSLLHLSGDYI